jgi:hypothetical protein
LFNDVQSSKAQRTSGTRRSIHQEGYVVVCSNTSIIEVVVENLPECDVILSFALVPIGTPPHEKEEVKDEESILLLKLAAQLLQRCVRGSWKVPTLLLSESTNEVGGGGGAAAVVHDVMFSVVEACRYFLSNRLEKMSRHYSDALSMCMNAKKGNHVLSGLVV